MIISEKVRFFFSFWKDILREGRFHEYVSAEVSRSGEVEDVVYTGCCV